MDGYIKLHRKILENPIVCKDAAYFAVWGYLLLNATHKECQSEFKGKKITLLPGQLITGRKAIAKQFKVDESKVQRVIKRLEIEHQIEQQTSNENRLITILNWNEYQQSEQQLEQPVNNQCTTDEQPVNTNKNDKNVKNDKNIIFNNIVELFHEICISYPKITKLSEARKKALSARLKTYTVEDFKKLFTMAEESKFLKGGNDRDWYATFDWMIKDSNMPKILDGNYKNKEGDNGKPGGIPKTTKSQSFTDLAREKGLL